MKRAGSREAGFPFPTKKFVAAALKNWQMSHAGRMLFKGDWQIECMALIDLLLGSKKEESDHRENSIGQPSRKPRW
jgi:hypothetical protein